VRCSSSILIFLLLTTTLAALFHQSAMATKWVDVDPSLTNWPLGQRIPGSLPALAETVASTTKLEGRVRSDDGRGLRCQLTIYKLTRDPWPKKEKILEVMTDGDGLYQTVVPSHDYYFIDVRLVESFTRKLDLDFSDYMEVLKLIKRDSSTVTANLELKRVGNIWLKAYDSQGRALKDLEFLRLAGASDPRDWDIGAFPLSVKVYDRSRACGRIVGKEPSLQVPIDQPVKIAAIWEVPTAGKIVFEADNGGQGFKLAWKEVLPINLVFEFAKTTYDRTRNEYDSKVREGYAPSGNVSSWLSSAAKNLDTARALNAKEDEAGCAKESYQVLSLSVKAREQLALDVARRDIEKYRKGEAIITLRGQDGRPIANKPVQIRQLNHDFIFNVGVHFVGARAGQEYPALKVMREFGVEDALITSLEISNHPQKGTYNFTSLSRIMDWVSGLGYRRLVFDMIVYYARSGGYFSALYPDYYHSLSPAELAREQAEYVANLVSRFGSRMAMYSIANEVGEYYSNEFNLSREEMLKVLAACFKAARDSKPDGIYTIKFGNPVGEIADRTWDDYTVSPEQWLDLMEGAGIQYEGIALQGWIGSLEEGADFGTWSSLLDHYALRGKKIYLTEMGYPNYEGRTDLKPLRWWHDGYNDQTQADYLRHFLTIGFSKPLVGLAGWYYVAERDRPGYKDDPSRYGNTLFDKDLKPRPVAYVMRDLLRSWTTVLNVNTDSNGVVTFRGFGGDYELEVQGYPKARFHIVERQETRLNIALGITSAVVSTVSSVSPTTPATTATTSEVTAPTPDSTLTYAAVVAVVVVGMFIGLSIKKRAKGKLAFSKTA